MLEQWLEDPYKNIINKGVTVYCLSLQEKLFKGKLLFQLLS